VGTYCVRPTGSAKNINTMQTDKDSRKETPADPDRWLSLKEAANYADCNEATLRRLIKAGVLRNARVGIGRKVIRLRRSWIDDALIACGTTVEMRSRP